MLGGRRPADHDPGEELEALRARLTATRWPDPELVTDFFRACSRR